MKPRKSKRHTYPRQDGGISDLGAEYRYGRDWSAPIQLPPDHGKLRSEKVIGKRAEKRKKKR